MEGGRPVRDRSFDATIRDGAESRASTASDAGSVSSAEERGAAAAGKVKTLSVDDMFEDLGIEKGTMPPPPAGMSAESLEKSVGSTRLGRDVDLDKKDLPNVARPRVERDRLQESREAARQMDIDENPDIFTRGNLGKHEKQTIESQVKALSKGEDAAEGEDAADKFSNYFEKLGLDAQHFALKVFTEASKKK